MTTNSLMFLAKKTTKGVCRLLSCFIQQNPILLFIGVATAPMLHGAVSDRMSLIGYLRCEIQAEAPGYLHQETHLWTIDSSKSGSGQEEICTGTWSVSGQGWLRRVEKSQSQVADWQIRAPGWNPAISATIHMYDQGEFLKLLSVSPLAMGRGALTGSSQLYDKGVPQAPIDLTRDVTGWQFGPLYLNKGGLAQVSGSTTNIIKDRVGPMQPTDALTTVIYTWSLRKSYPSPLPPPALTPRPAPNSTSIAGNAAPPAQPGSPDSSSSNAAQESRILGLERLVAQFEGTISELQRLVADLARRLEKLESTAGNVAAARPSAGSSPGTTAGTTGGTASNSGANGSVPARGTAVPAPTINLRERPRLEKAPTSFPSSKAMTSPSRAPTSGAATPPASGNYLVTMTGVWCGKPTLDDPLEFDGKGDEIYCAAYVRQYDRKSFSIVDSAQRWTKEYGDANGSDRVQAGSRSRLGGIKEGDSIPPNASATRIVAAQENLFPLKLWQGTLTDGADALVISPSVWESDGENSYFIKWVNKQRDLNDSIFLATSVQNQINQRVFGPLDLEATESVSGVISESIRKTALGGIQAAFAGIPPLQFFTGGHDRPIGLVKNSINQNALPNTTVILTREIIESALATAQPPVANPWPNLEIPVTKPGILVITFLDHDGSPASNTILGDNRAMYAMTLQVERVP